MPNATHDSLRAAVIDGRAHNIFYKLEALEKLHASLLKESTTIISAITQDTRITNGEARYEYSQALDAIRNRYDELDHPKALKEEYSVANVEDAATTRVGYGLAVIRPSQHSPFFSIVAPLSAAIVAGNCVVIELQSNLKHLPKLIQDLAPFGLDPDSVLVTTKSSGKEFDDLESITVIQEQSEGTSAKTNLTSTSRNLSVAIVDRAADFETAARSLVAARFSFGGRSPYAPDIVLVNEFVKQKFLQAIVQQAIAFESDQRTSSDSLSNPRADPKNGSGRIVTETAVGSVVEVSNQQNVIFSKIQDPILRVTTITSLDHALNLLDDTPLLCLSFFGGPAEAKYITQAARAQLSLVNSIPTELLVGPAFPQGHTIELKTRYPTNLFSRPAPAFIETQSTHSTALTKAHVSAIFAAAVKPLLKKKRTKGLTAAFGFFEQAFILHFGLVVVSSISVLVGGIWWLIRRQFLFGRRH